MVLTTDLTTADQYNYDQLMVALEASLGKLALLLLVCDDRNLRAAVMNRYEQELQAGGTQTFRFILNRQDPSLRAGLATLVSHQPALQNEEPAIATVLGIDDLLPPMLAIPVSQQETFFGYLQWTREALLNFQFPVVLWLNSKILPSLIEKAPDFWSWRTGVYWFGVDPQGLKVVEPSITQPQTEAALVPTELLDDLTRLIAILDQQATPGPEVLVNLDSKLSELYGYRGKSVHNRELVILFYQRVTKLLRKFDLKPELADKLEALGNLYFERRYDTRSALPYYEEALTLHREVGNRLGEANTLRAIGDVLQFLDQRQAALSRYDEALTLYRDMGAQLGEADTLKATGDVLQFLDQYQEALRHYDEALDLYRDLGALLGEANILNATGNTLHFLNQHQAALNRYDEALKLYRDVGDRLGAANTLKDIGDILQFLDQRQAALSHYDKALTLYRDMGVRLGEANTLKAIGDILQFLDQHQTALSRYDEALTLYRDMGARPGEANTLKAIGDILQFLDQRQVALSCYGEALALYYDVKDRLGEANTLQSIGNYEPDLMKAMTMFQSALEIYENIGHKYSQAKILLQSIAPTYLKQQQVELGKKALLNARHLFSEVNFAGGVDIVDRQLKELSEHS
jgi:tetratricopeptide (TPR) repeat protein